MMTNKQRREELIAELEENIFGLETVHQRKPYTCYTASTKWNGIVYELMGFTKVCYPDTWDAKYGRELAKKKALAYCAKEILNGESSTWFKDVEIFTDFGFGTAQY